MNQNKPTGCSDAVIEEDHPISFRLFNDVNFGHQVPLRSRDATWAPFRRLPPELRSQIWLFFLRRHRMIEVDICGDPNENDMADTGDVSQSRYYSSNNSLGRVVSGRGYILRIPGRRGYASSLSPLFWVNNEARQAALRFYQIRLPFPGQQGEQVLYLNREYDVVFVRVQGYDTLLADFLHDVKAYDYQNQGIAHLVLERLPVSLDFSINAVTTRVHLTPAALHPTAAASFADILLHRLRSVLCPIGFRSRSRGLAELPTNNWRYHFAQTFPLCRQGQPTSAFHWHESDPRPGVQLDLRQVPFADDPRNLTRCWELLEQAFGITKEQRAGSEFQFYICPAIRWPQRQLVGINTVQEQGGTREELAKHLQWEADYWLRNRKFIGDKLYQGRMYPRHGQMIDAETFEMMEKVPCTAVGMWIFPPEAFKEPTILRRFCFDLSAVKPGLLLFEV